MKLFQAVVEGAPNAMVMVNQKGRIILVNSQAERLFGYSREELVGQSVEVLLPAAERHAHEKYRTGYNQDPQRRAMGAGRDLVGLRKDGKTIPVEIGLNPIETPEDGRCVLASIIDITERRAAERERLRLQKQVLDASERERRRIGQDLHDSLGQKLLGVGLLIKAIKDDLERDAPQHAADADRVIQLVNETLDETRQLARGLYAAELQANDLPTALRQLTVNVRSMSGIDCEFLCETNRRDYDPTIATNAFRIAQEALNNAVKHSRATRIEVILKDDHGGQTLTVKDNGVGLPESISSSGIGLEVMRYRADMVGGTCVIGRVEGGGTAVVCSLPHDPSELEATGGA